MAATGLGGIYAALSPSRTYEGETYVLAQQIGNAVVKHWKKYVRNQQMTLRYQSFPVRQLTMRHSRSENSFSALSYVARVRNGAKMSQKAQSRDASSWFDPRLQEDFLEHRAALLAKRHLDDVSRGKDTSYDVFDLTMAHADLTYWRGLRAQVDQGPRNDRETLEALANVVSTEPTHRRLERREVTNG